MIRELMQQRKPTIGSGGDHGDQVWKRNDIGHNHYQYHHVPSGGDLSLGPSLMESDGGFCRKRKKNRWDEDHSFNVQTNIELQLKDPLPPDWEQCLDLQSGRMYYLNRRTSRKSWEWPREHKLDLELNISTLSSDDNIDRRSGSSSSSSTSSRSQMDNLTNNKQTNSSSSRNMVAVPCLKCHLLVMLCTSSPSCPNCKYVHSLPALQRPSPTAQILAESRINGTKPLETLSLLN